MIVNQQNIKELFVGYNASFQAAYDAQLKNQNMMDYAQISTRVPSSSKENLYPWLSRWPKIRKWVGDRHLKNLEVNGYRIANEKYEASIQVPRDDIEDDSYGIYTPEIQGHARSVADFPNEKVMGLLAAGATSLCYDGQNFFDTDHPVKDSNGIETLYSNYVSGASPAWYLLDTTQSMRPLIQQVRRDFGFRAVTNLEDAQVFMRDEFLFGVDGRMGFGYGFWQMARRMETAINATTLDDNLKAMMSLKDEEGRPLGIRPNLLVCGVSNRAAALQAVKADLVPWPATVAGASGTQATGGNTNYNKDVVQVMISPWLP